MWVQGFAFSSSVKKELSITTRHIVLDVSAVSLLYSSLKSVDSSLIHCVSNQNLPSPREHALLLLWPDGPQIAWHGWNVIMDAKSIYLISPTKRLQVRLNTSSSHSLLNQCIWLKNPPVRCFCFLFLVFVFLYQKCFLPCYAIYYHFVHHTKLIHFFSLDQSLACSYGFKSCSFKIMCAYHLVLGSPKRIFYVTWSVKNICSTSKIYIK